LLITELDTSSIPEIYTRFAKLVGEKHWRQRIFNVKQEIKGNKFLHDHLHQENSIAFQLENMRELTEKFGAIPAWEIENERNYPAASFCAQVLSFIEKSPIDLSERFRRRVHGALKNPDDMRGLRLELSVATHFIRRGCVPLWPELTGDGTFDLLLQDFGANGLEVECKAISQDKGQKIHKREFLDFIALLQPHLRTTTIGLNAGLSCVLTLQSRLPKNYSERQALAKEVAQAIFLGRNTALRSGGSIRFREFDPHKVEAPLSTKNVQKARAIADEVTETTNRPTVMISTKSGGSLIISIQSTIDDALMDTILDTLRYSSKRQLSGTRAAVFLVGFQGISPAQMLSIADQDKNPMQGATGLRIAASEFLGSDARDHVVGIGFLSDGAPISDQSQAVELGGAAYFFSKQESPMWSSDLGSLFSWISA
jgi:hypothetical protein